MKVRVLVQQIAIAILGLSFSAAGQSVEVWLSTEDGAHSLAAREPLAFAPVSEVPGEKIVIDTETKYQSILGMGASFDHSTCYNLSLLDEATREEVIHKLVDPVDGLGMNLMRLCIGTSDFTNEPYYSYDDMPDGETDPDLAHFSIEKDKAYVLPVVKSAQAKNPDLLFFASPWSPPAWMKTTGAMSGGKLDQQYYPVYAQYLLKFLRAYEAEGVPVLAMTLQNEPAHVDPNYPTCLWKGEEQRDFIRDHAGPLFQKEKINTLLWCWDHNYNLLEFPRAVLDDSEAAKYVDGTAFHFYEGKPEAMTVLRDEFPGKHIYFTEGSTFRSRGAIQIINIFRNWARSYNTWVVLLDEKRKPNRGPHHASRTCIELDSKDKTVSYQFDYYMYGQFMKFIARGAERIDSTPGTYRFNNIVFRNPDGPLVLVAANAAGEEQPFSVVMGERMFQTVLPKRSVATFRWKD